MNNKELADELAAVVEDDQIPAGFNSYRSYVLGRGYKLVAALRRVQKDSAPHTLDDKSRAYHDACLKEHFTTDDLQYTAEGALAWSCFNAGYDMALLAPAGVVQIGWCGPFGIIPGGMDNEPAPGWRPIYTDALTPAAPTPGVSGGPAGVLAELRQLAYTTYDTSFDTLSSKLAAYAAAWEKALVLLAAPAAPGVGSGVDEPDYPPLGVDLELICEAKDALLDAGQPSYSLAIEALVADWQILKNKELASAPAPYSLEAAKAMYADADKRAVLPVVEARPAPTSLVGSEGGQTVDEVLVLRDRVKDLKQTVELERLHSEHVSGLLKQCEKALEESHARELQHLATPLATTGGGDDKRTAELLENAHAFLALGKLATRGPWDYGSAKSNKYDELLEGRFLYAQRRVDEDEEDANGDFIVAARRFVDYTLPALLKLIPEQNESAGPHHQEGREGSEPGEGVGND